MKSLEYQSKRAKSLMMGPSSLRIAEELCSGLELPAGSRILDLGCGRGLSSLYLARRFPDALVFAADLWIDPEENLATFRDAGSDNRIIPVRAEAHELPFAAEYFDAIVSIDSYHYFGADPAYLGSHLAPLLTVGGTLLMAVPGWRTGYDGGIPEELSPWLKAEMHFHTAAWWQGLWNTCSMVRVTEARDLECNLAAWEDWLSCDNDYAREDRPMLDADAGRWLALAAVNAVRI